MKKELSEIIEKRRKFLGLTQSTLAERSGISLRSLKMMEAGDANPTLEQVEKVLKVLGMKLLVVVK